MIHRHFLSLKSPCFRPRSPRPPTGRNLDILFAQPRHLSRDCNLIFAIRHANIRYEAASRRKRPQIGLLPATTGKLQLTDLFSNSLLNTPNFPNCAFQPNIKSTPESPPDPNPCNNKPLATAGPVASNSPPPPHLGHITAAASQAACLHRPADAIS